MCRGVGFAGAAPLLGACSSYLVSAGSHLVLLDCGPGTLERLYRLDVLRRLDAIVISHMHMDHMLDLLPLSGGISRREFGGRRPTLYVPQSDSLEILRSLDDVFATEPRGATQFDAAFQIRLYDASSCFEIGPLSITFAPTAHSCTCYAVRVSAGRASVVYGADGANSRALEEHATQTDLLILEATFADDRQAAAKYLHMTAAQAGEFASRVGAGRLLLTHLLPGSGLAHVELAARSFDGAVELAREGLSYEL